MHLIDVMYISDMASVRIESAGSREKAQTVAYSWLKRHVATLPRNEGTFLTEAAVAEATGTSRTPVREAFLRLEAEGLLQILPRKGAFVPPISDEQVETVMQARHLVEDWCVRRSVSSGHDLAHQLDALVARQESLLQEPVEFIECDREFHRTIVHAAQNPVIADFYESLRDRQLRMGVVAVAKSPERARTVLHEHAAIVEAIRAHDAELAARAIGAHLESTLATLRLPHTSRWPGSLNES